MGRKLLILGHHYQQDEVIAHSRSAGGQLSAQPDGGREPRLPVHRVLRRAFHGGDGGHPGQPAGEAGRARRRAGHGRCCPTWRPAARWPTWPPSTRWKAAWDDLGEVIDTSDITPVTYINSAASLKAFCGRHGGIVCTISNAQGGAGMVVSSALAGCSSFPISTWAATLRSKMGITNEQMPVWDPYAGELAATREARLPNSKVVLWKGHCSVHQMFRREHVELFRKKHPGHQDPGASRMSAGSERHGRRSGLARARSSRRSKQPRPAPSGPSAPSCTW